MFFVIAVGMIASYLDVALFGERGQANQYCFGPRADRRVD